MEKSSEALTPRFLTEAEKGEFLQDLPRQVQFLLRCHFIAGDLALDKLDELEKEKIREEGFTNRYIIRLHTSETRVAELEAKLAQVEVKPCEYFAAQVADCLGIKDVPKLMGEYLSRACEVVAKVVELRKQLQLATAAIDESSTCPACESTKTKNVCLSCGEDWGY